MKSRFDGLITLITGGGSGIGAALCRRIAAPGQGIIIHTGSNMANVERVAAEVEKAGAIAVPVTCNFTGPADAASLINRAQDRFGRLDQSCSSSRLRRPAQVRRPGRGRV